MPCTAHTRIRAFHSDDGGFSTVGMALALLLTLSLLFASAQVYRIQSACAQVQNVADAAALAAENQVASFYVVAQASDSVSLSLSLAGTVCMGVGVVALCIPPVQLVGERLIDAGVRIFDARDAFARSAAQGLNRLQRLLPFLAAMQAAGVAAANSSPAQAYVGIAVLAPFEGKEISAAGLAGAQELAQQALEHQDSIAQAARESEEAGKEADEHKMRAFMADCGAAPGYCMQERAASLAGMEGSENPHYSSVDAWSFGVGLLRARAYYQHRLEQEAPLDESVEELAASALRTRFYAFACQQMAEGYVYDTPEGFDAHFPLLPRNTEQMRQTSLYTEDAYPFTFDEEGQMLMHAWDGCPQMEGCEFAGVGSVAFAEEQGLPACPDCGMCASRLGRVAAASTSIPNGFEHHYLILAQEAEAYQGARERLDSQSQQAKSPVATLLESLGSLVSSAARARIEAAPPGRIGAIAVVVAPGGTDVGSLVPTSFVAGSGTLGTRAAIAGATLADDEPTETANVISSLADGLSSRLPALGSLPQLAVQVWGAALGAYARGHEGLLSAIRDSLNALPLASRAGLGSWAAGKLEDAIAEAGYEPPELAAYKPVLVNTYHVAAADGSAAAGALVRAKQSWGGRLGHDGGNALAAAAGVAGSMAIERIDDAAQGVVVASIQLLGEAGPSFDIRIALPPGIADAVSAGAASAVDAAVQALAGLPVGVQEVRRWE